MIIIMNKVVLMQLPRYLSALTLIVTVSLASGCSTPSTPNTDVAPPASATTTTETSPERATETAANTPRLAYAYNGGIRVLDALTLEEVSSFALPGINRLYRTGDERTVLVSTAEGFFVLDLGVYAIAHGDHSHYYKTSPTLTNAAAPNATPVDSNTAEPQPVELPAGAAYLPDSLAWGEDGELLVLGTDGKLHIINPESGMVTASYQVMSAWQLPAEPQEPSPRLFVLEGMAYITDPAQQRLYSVYPATGEIWKQTNLPNIPIEIIGVTGAKNSTGEHLDDHGHDD
jgi:outer membrane protein assembly factor BamB